MYQTIATQKGIRVVLTLESGIQIDSNNTGTGIYGSSYELK
jgi:hypothetical protein